MPPSAVSRGRRAAETHEEEESEDDVQIDEVDDNDVEGDEGDEDDEDDWESEEEEIAPRVLPQRSNRGNRLAKLIQEGEEEDEFWDVMKEVFVEDANDSDFEAEEEEDVVDDDFDAPEPAAGEDDEEYENDTGANADRNLQREERSKLKKQPGYVDPRKKGANAAAAGSDAGAAKKPRVARTSAAAATTTTTDVSGAAAGGSEGIASHRTQRRSVAKAQELRAQERAEQDAALTARARARGMTKEELLARQRERSQTVHRALTQKEQLEQAKLTEIHNKNSLEELLKIEEAQKRITVRKRGVIGPAIFTRDRAGAAAVSFKHCVPFGYAIELAAAAAAAATGVSANSSRVVMLDGDGGDDAAFRPPVRRRRLHAPAPLSCAVTGAPARYRDPVTGLPFASAAVLPQLRRRAQTGELTREAYERAHFADVALDAATYGADPAAAAAAAAAGAAMGDDDEVRPATKTPGRGRKAAAK